MKGNEVFAILIALLAVTTAAALLPSEGLLFAAIMVAFVVFIGAVIK